MPWTLLVVLIALWGSTTVRTASYANGSSLTLGDSVDRTCCRLEPKPAYVTCQDSSSSTRASSCGNTCSLAGLRKPYQGSSGTSRERSMRSSCSWVTSLMGQGLVHGQERTMLSVRPWRGVDMIKRRRTGRSASPRAQTWSRSAPMWSSFLGWGRLMRRWCLNEALGRCTDTGFGSAGWCRSSGATSWRAEAPGRLLSWSPIGGVGSMTWSTTHSRRCCGPTSALLDATWWRSLSRVWPGLPAPWPLLRIAVMSGRRGWLLTLPSTSLRSRPPCCWPVGYGRSVGWKPNLRMPALSVSYASLKGRVTGATSLISYVCSPRSRSKSSGRGSGSTWLVGPRLEVGHYHIWTSASPQAEPWHDVNLMFLRSMCLMHSRSSGRRTGMAEQGLTHTPPHRTQQAHIPEPQASLSPSAASAPRWRRPGRRRLQVRIYTCLGVIWLFFYLFVQAYDDLCLLWVHPARHEDHVGMFTQFSRSASSHSREDDDDDAYGRQAETLSGLSGPKSGGSEVIHLRRSFYSSWLFILILYVQLTFTAGVRVDVGSPPISGSGNLSGKFGRELHNKRGQLSSVCKRTYKRAVARAAVHGGARYKGRWMTPKELGQQYQSNMEQQQHKAHDPRRDKPARHTQAGRIRLMAVDTPPVPHKRDSTVARTPNPDNKRQRHKSSKGQGKGKTRSVDTKVDDSGHQGMDSLLRLVAKLTLQHEDQHSLNRLDTTMHLWLRNTGKESLLATMHGVSKRWKDVKDTDPGKLEGSLRATLFGCLMLEYKQRLINVRDQPGMLERVAKMGWTTAEGKWTFQRWDPETEELRVDESRQAQSLDEILEQVETCLACNSEPVLHRFHSLRPLVANPETEFVQFVIEVGHRGDKAQRMYQTLLGMRGSSALQLIGARLRESKPTRSGLARRIQEIL